MGGLPLALLEQENSVIVGRVPIPLSGRLCVKRFGLRWIAFRAASEAQKAVDYIMDRTAHTDQMAAE